jgi:hypothetical protein
MNITEKMDYMRHHMEKYFGSNGSCMDCRYYSKEIHGPTDEQVAGLFHALILIGINPNNLVQYIRRKGYKEFTIAPYESSFGCCMLVEWFVNFVEKFLIDENLLRIYGEIGKDD